MLALTSLRRRGNGEWVEEESEQKNPRYSPLLIIQGQDLKSMIVAAIGIVTVLRVMLKISYMIIRFTIQMIPPKVIILNHHRMMKIIMMTTVRIVMTRRMTMRKI